MKSFFRFLILINCALSSKAQVVNHVTFLSDSLQETSGLMQLDSVLITHNDSGGAPVLYEIDTLMGSINRTVNISNATHVDWEAITRDETYIYIGDFGNNQGSRTDLKIYRVLISDYLNTINDSVVAEVINFSYADQTNFLSNPLGSNYDAEAFIAHGDSLYIFSKNWENFNTNIYAVSIQPGNYIISKIDSLNVQGLITDATYNSGINTLVLIGYGLSPFIVKLDQFSFPYFSNGNLIKSNIMVQHSIQIEGITHLENETYYLSAEVNFTGAASLYRLNNAINLEVIESNTSPIKVFPNPMLDGIVNVYFPDDLAVYMIEIYNLKGQVVYRGDNEIKIDISRFGNGIYEMVIWSDYGMFTKRLVKSNK